MTFRWRCVRCRRSAPVVESLFPLTCKCGQRHDWPEGVLKTPPSLLQRAVNFAGSATLHAASGLKVVDDATRDWRLSQCQACELFNKELETCTHPRCGCGMKKQRGIIDALGWASKRCPIGRWEYAPIETRNLIYHVCALKANDGWQQNIMRLVHRWGVFNGRRVIAIATGEGLHSPAAVHRAFGVRNYEILLVPNDTRLREVKSFLPLLESIESPDHAAATFYAHTKGNSTAGGMAGATRWRNAMYRHLLDKDLDRSMELLRRHVFVGCHKMVWGSRRKPPYPSGLVHGDWFLAGTFFWFRNDIVFGSRKWRDIPDDRYGAEAWPAGIVDEHAAASVYQKFPETQSYTNIDNPYNPDLYEGEGLDDEPLCQSA